MFPLGVSDILHYPIYNFRIMFTGIPFTYFTQFFLK